ncbi:MAG: preprotein translocase subunit SecA [Candidatus Colwellbacteria bacterium]|nr:preprotein translocase subunit SecA [Candidatus Colwellbacteria bacterium]
MFDFLFNARARRARSLVESINSFEERLSGESREALRERSERLRERAKSEELDELLPEAFALVREAAKRTLGERHYDVQLIGGVHLHWGRIVEMLTGEGKTLAATLPAYLNSLADKGVHVITVNDYLARRDVSWMGQIYHFLGVPVSCLVHDGAYVYDPAYVPEGEADRLDRERDETGSFRVYEQFLRPIARGEAYRAGITYGTNHEFGFDYLRDNLAYRAEGQAQIGRGHAYAIIDEVDSILIDEARTPLIIAAPDESSSEYYKIFTRAVSGLERGADYLVDEKQHSAEITESGIDKVEAATGVSDLFHPDRIRLVHYLEACLKARALYERDRDYVVRDGEVVIVDQFTGRLMLGRRYSAGLHQALEAKEGVAVQSESRTYAQITIQNYFRLYTKLAGMTGTAQTSAEEFHKVYGLSVESIPPNKPMIRADLPDVIYKNARAKYQAVAEEVKRRNAAGQPVLIGTVSIEKNEFLARYLAEQGIGLEVLNAKNHEREGAIIAQAGRLAAVTLATNMAGRGVDIVLGGKPVIREEADTVRAAGGLHVIGTERHESRRIDNQLRGRSGRQGDQGSSQFFLSLEDDLMRIFGGERIKRLMESLNIPEDQPIESRLVSKVIEEAQKKVEGLNFDMRKHLLDYDDILNKQRANAYRMRQGILKANANSLRETIFGWFAEHEREASHEHAPLRELLADDRVVLRLAQPLLGVLDALWMDHLENIEALSESVRIRAYGQRDPLVEYRHESHMLFQNLLAQFKGWVSHNLEELVSRIQTDLSRSSGDVGASEPATPKGELPREVLAQTGRNDPCPCGAKHPDGRPVKFKKCHGK